MDNNTKELFPKNIGLFELGLCEKSKSQRTWYLSYYACSDKLRLYIDYTFAPTYSFQLSIYESIGKPYGEGLFSNTFTTLDECIDAINEWCFLNDNLFVQAAK